MITVSVPLSGLTSVNIIVVFKEDTMKYTVSVPLSGLTSVNYICWSKYESGYVEFPSPYRG